MARALEALHQRREKHLAGSFPKELAGIVSQLNKLLEARTQLANLLTYMDGKTGAEEIIMKAIKDPALLQALASAPKPAGDQ